MGGRGARGGKGKIAEQVGDPPASLPQADHDEEVAVAEAQSGGGEAPAREEVKETSQDPPDTASEAQSATREGAAPPEENENAQTESRGDSVAVEGVPINGDQEDLLSKVQSVLSAPDDEPASEEDGGENEVVTGESQSPPPPRRLSVEEETAVWKTMASMAHKQQADEVHTDKRPAPETEEVESISKENDAAEYKNIESEPENKNELSNLGTRTPPSSDTTKKEEEPPKDTTTSKTSSKADPGIPVVGSEADSAAPEANKSRIPAEEKEAWAAMSQAAHKQVTKEEVTGGDSVPESVGGEPVGSLRVEIQSEKTVAEDEEDEERKKSGLTLTLPPTAGGSGIPELSSPRSGIPEPKSPRSPGILDDTRLSTQLKPSPPKQPHEKPPPRMPWLKAPNRNRNRSPSRNPIPNPNPNPRVRSQAPSRGVWIRRIKSSPS